jgi:hypothetical protein
MKPEETKIYKFVENYCKENNFEFKNQYDITHHNDRPYDSIDRFIALYIIENEQELLNRDLPTIKTQEDLTNWYESIDSDFKEQYEGCQFWSYNNYEREGMGNDYALYQILRVAKEGKDIVLKDGYYDGGWFGAS